MIWPTPAGLAWRQEAPWQQERPLGLLGFSLVCRAEAEKDSSKDCKASLKVDLT